MQKKIFFLNVHAMKVFQCINLRCTDDKKIN